MKVIGLAGWSGSGKTTLLTKLIPYFTAEGLRVSTIKHAHHNFDIDIPGKDSWRHREAGATEVIVASGRRWALIHELRDEPEPPLTDLLKTLARVDLVLIEGFKTDSHPKIEVHRSAIGSTLLFPQDAAIVGVVSDIELETTLPTAHIDDIPGVARLLNAKAVRIEDVLEQQAAGA